MKIPKSLKIGGHRYKIRLIDMGDMGKTDRGKNVIYIDKTLPQDQQEATLIHEILHALNNELNHTTLDSLAEQIYQVIRENKWMK